MVWYAYVPNESVDFCVWSYEDKHRQPPKDRNPPPPPPLPLHNTSMSAHAAKKRKLSVRLLGGYVVEEADELLNENEDKITELRSALALVSEQVRVEKERHARTFEDFKSFRGDAKRKVAESAAIKRRLYDGVREKLKAARAGRDQAIAARVSALSERDQAVQERDQAIAARVSALSERDQAFLDENAATQERDQAIVARVSALSERDQAVQERDQAVQERDQAVQERTDALEEQHSAKLTLFATTKLLTKAEEKNKTAHELGRREGAADIAASNARADHAVASLGTELSESKRFQEELEATKKQLRAAVERLNQIAGFQREQARMQALMMNPNLLRLGDQASPPQSGSAGDGDQAIETVD